MTETTYDPDEISIRDDLRALRERRPLELVLLGILATVGTALTVATIYFAWERFTVRKQFAVAFFGVGLFLYYTLETLSLVDGSTDVYDRYAWVYRGLAAVVRRVPLSERRQDRLDGAVAYLRPIEAWLCFLSGVAAAGAAGWVYWNYDRLTQNAIVFGFEPIDLYVGLVVIAVTIDATRRAYGWSIAAVALASVVYAYFGPAMPGFLRHPGFSLTDVSTFGAVRVSGAFNFIMEIGATWVAIFIMFAGLARVYGALDVILGVGQRLGAHLHSGVVHVAVISSMIMGSITGSAAANTATTGSFTIPMMQRQGVRADFAAAIESVASSGGQILPPVMGVAAFLMPVIIGDITYVDVIKAAVIPALLFYFSVLVAVQIAVYRYGWTTERQTDVGLVATFASRRALLRAGYALLAALSFVGARQLASLGLLPSAGVVVAALVGARLLQAVLNGSDRSITAEFVAALAAFCNGAHFAIPMTVLLYTLVVMELSPMSAGLYTTVTLVVTMAVRDQIVFAIARTGEVTAGTAEPSLPRRSARTAVWTVYNTLRGFVRGASDMAPLVGVLAAMGIIVSMVTETGLTGKISTRMVALGGGVLLVVLLLAMVTSILFGLGMPTPAAYILVATLLTSPIVEFGVADITAHLFVFYFAMLSAITPPVAVAVAVGSRIANTSFLGASKQALRIGAVGFLVPYAFITNPSLIIWAFPETLVALGVLLVAVVGVTVSTIGYDGERVLSLPGRLGYMLLSLLAMFAPGLAGYVGAVTADLLQVAAAVALLVALALVRLGRLPRPSPAAAGAEE